MLRTASIRLGAGLGDLGHDETIGGVSGGRRRLATDSILVALVFAGAHRLEVDDRAVGRVCSGWFVKTALGRGACRVTDISNRVAF